MNFIVQIFQLFFELLESLLKGLFELIEGAVSVIPKKNKGYKADFASPSILLSSRHSGFCLTGDKNLSVKMSYQNCLVVGGTGTGKSSVVLIPSLFSMEGTYIIHDPSGELYAKSAGYLQSRGYAVKTLNFANPENSSGYNPLARANTSSDIQKIAAMLVVNSIAKGNADPFWTKMGEGLLSMLITVLKTQDREFQTLFNVRHLLNLLGGSPEKVDGFFGKCADPLLWGEYKSFMSHEEKIVSGVVASGKAALGLFADDAIAKVTSFDSLDFADFRRKKVALFIQNSVADQKYYSILTSLFFEQFFKYLLSRFPDEGEQDIFLLIDEASSLNLPTLPLAVANVRKHRAGIMLLLQDYNQLVNLYSKEEAEAIRSNCFAQLYFTGQGLHTAKELSEILGKYEYWEKEKGGKTEKKVVRPLMTPDEIRTMKTTEALLICGNYKPVKLKLKPYYRNSSLLGYSRIAPVKTGGIASNSLPTLSLDRFAKKANSKPAQ